MLLVPEKKLITPDRRLLVPSRRTFIKGAAAATLCAPHVAKALTQIERAAIQYQPPAPTGGGGVTGWASLIPQSGLLHAWPFDNTYSTTSTVSDPIGSSNASMSNFTLQGSGPTTHLNNAGLFNGTSSIGVCSGSLLTSEPFTLNAWVWAISTAVNAILLGNTVDASNNGVSITSFFGNFAQAQAGNGTTNASATQSDGGTNWNGNAAWNMITFTWDGTTLWNYPNGNASTNLFFSTALAGPMGAPTLNWTFGADATGANFLDGKLAGVAIWNRVLSSTEIAAVFAL
jgi:hypothetical protein